MQLQGLRELNEVLKQLPDSLQATAMRNAGRSALRSMLETARANAPVSDGPHTLRGRKIAPGFGRDAIRLWSPKSAVKGLVTLVLGIPAKSDAFYMRFVEYGHRIIPPNRRGYRIEGNAKRGAKHGATDEQRATYGATSPKPWLRPAFDAHAQGTLKDLRVSLWKEIQKQAKRLAGKYSRVRKALTK